MEAGEIARGLSATQKSVVQILADRRFYPVMLRATKRKLMDLGLVERSIGNSIRLTELGRSVAAELNRADA